jgi:hypothetical protein
VPNLGISVSAKKFSNKLFILDTRTRFHKFSSKNYICTCIHRYNYGKCY